MAKNHDIEPASAEWHSSKDRRYVLDSLVDECVVPEPDCDEVVTEGPVAVALANPTEFPEPLRPRGAVGHHVPISPYRRRNVDRVELGCYTGRRLLDGTLPDRLVYLSLDPAGDGLRTRIDRQHAWLGRLLGDDIHRLDRFVGAPESDAGLGWEPNGIESVSIDCE